MALDRRNFSSRAFLLAVLCGGTHALGDTWDNSAGNAQWSTANNWADNSEPTINDAAIFPVTIPLNQGTILMTTTEFAASLTFNNDYTLQGGQMFVGGGGVNVAGGRTATINTVINGSAGLAKTGFGTLRLLPTSSNSFSGPISITGINSTLYVRSNVSLGNTANDIDINAGRLQLDGVTNPTFLMTGRTITPGSGGGAIELLNNAFLDLNTGLGANANALTFTGQGTVELNSPSARTGPTFVSSVLLRLNGATALGTPGSASLTSGAVMEINNGSGLFAGTVSFGAGTTLRGGAGTHTYGGIANVGGNMTLNGGPGGSDVLIMSGDAVRQGAGFTTTVAVGTVRLDAANSYAGGWTVGGRLEVRHPGALGTGTTPIVVNPSGTLILNTPTLVRDITLNSPGGGIQLLQDAAVTGQIPIAASPGFVPILGPDHEFTLTGNTSSMTYSGIAFFGGSIGIGSLRVEGGADVAGTSARVVGTASGPGRLTVSGVGSSWTNSDELWIGHFGDEGSLLVEAGGAISCPAVWIGQQADAIATITGAGSLFTSTEVLIVGFAGTSSTLSVLDGADVAAAEMRIGDLAGATGGVTVAGAGSTLTTQGVLEVGKVGIGTLNVTPGGEVSCPGLALGDGAASSGSCTITGGLSRLLCGAPGVVLGRNGATGVLNLSGGGVDIHGDVTVGGAGASTFILSGATLDMHGFAIGGSSPIDNLQFRSGTLKNVSGINGGAGLMKTGPGVLYLNTDNTYGGPTTVAEGTLFVVNLDGSATGAGQVTVAGGATLEGPGRAGGTVTNNGFVAPEGFIGNQVGTLTLLDGYTQGAGGALVIEVGGPSFCDTLSIEGAASLGGSLSVTLVNGYEPVAGDAFTFLEAASVTGTFASMSLPPLDGGLEWRVEYSGDRVRLLVGSPCSANIDDDGDYTNGLTPDGGVDVNDLLAFLGAFEAGNLGVDLDDDGADPPASDGGVDVNDLIFFLARFEGGC